MKAIVLLLVMMAGIASAQESKSMPVDAKPGFEVATIKPSDPAAQGTSLGMNGGRFVVRNQRVWVLIAFAYGLHPDQIVNQPAWMKDRYDVQGVPDVLGEPNMVQMQEMMRHLLAERFGLKFHREDKEISNYTILLTKGGLKAPASKKADAPLPNVNVDGGPHRRSGKFSNITMDEFAQSMQAFMDRPVVNQTGLPGRYDLALTWNPDLTEDAESADVPTLFTAMREQLGLRMEPRKGPVSVLVVDAVARPTEN